jgi:hypothetical protein
MEVASAISIAVLLAAIALRRPLIEAVINPGPGNAVILMSFLYLSGCAVLTWTAGEGSAFMASVCGLFFFLYAVTYYFVSIVFELRIRPPDCTWRPFYPGSTPYITKVWLFFLFFLLLVGFAVVWSGGLNLLLALYNFLLTGDIEITVGELRTAFASGEERWVGPGYLKQFRDILLPLSLLLVLYSIPRTAGKVVLITLIFVPSVFLLMLSSGERAPIVLLTFALIHASRRASRSGYINKKAALAQTLMLIALAAAVFTALTSSFVYRDYGDKSFMGIFLDRIVTRSPEENLFGIEFWTRGAPYPGAGWISELMSVVPGTQVTLSGIIHEFLGGGVGNSVLGLWIDVYYNFGWMLGCVVSVLLGVFIALFNHWVNVKRTVSPTGDLCGLWLSISMLLVISPFAFLLYGPFVLSCLLFLLAWQSGVRHTAKR